MVRDPGAVASFAQRIRQLEKLLRPALLIENAPIGSLEKAAARGGGSLLAVCNESLFGAVSGARRDLELLVRTWQGKSSQTALLQDNAVASPVRPLVGALFPIAIAPTGLKPPTCISDDAYAQLRTAIEVLNKLGERLNTHAEHSVMQLAESPLGAHYAGRIEVGTIEQTTRIESRTPDIAPSEMSGFFQFGNRIA